MAYVPVEITSEQIAALEAEHEDILEFHGSEKSPWVMVLKRPNRQQTIAYKQHAMKDRATANEALIRRIVVAPTGADLEKQLERWPMLCDGIADQDSFKEFLGIAIDAQVK